MKAIVINSYGDTNVFCETELPTPHPKANELLVQVHATSVNPVDYKIRKGFINTGVGFPQILGFDVSGVVEEVGKSVKDFKTGDEVYYLPQIMGSQGSYAEYHLVEENIVSKKPKNLSHIEAASIPLVGSTSWDALVDRIKIKKGESILIHAGAGGVGSFAIQLAKFYGAFVWTTCSSANHDLVKKLGADVIIDYKKEDFVKVIENKTNKEGIDIVFDTVGEAILTKSLDVVKPLGRVATIVRVPTDLSKAFLKNIDIHPVFVQSGRKKLDSIRELLEKGLVKSVIDSVMLLKDIKKAHEKIEKGGIRGKIVINVGA